MQRNFDLCHKEEQVTIWSRHITNQCHKISFRHCLLNPLLPDGLNSYEVPHPYCLRSLAKTLCLLFAAFSSFFLKRLLLWVSRRFMALNLLSSCLCHFCSHFSVIKKNVSDIVIKYK